MSKSEIVLAPASADKSVVLEVISRSDGTRRVISKCVGPSLTKQSFAPECDIQNIVKRALAGQPVSQVDDQPIYADVSALPDYQTSLNTVIATEAVFGRLDAVTRQGFDNNPQNMLAFLANPANARKAVQLGLLDPSALPPAEPLSAAPQGAAPAP